MKRLLLALLLLPALIAAEPQQPQQPPYILKPGAKVELRVSADGRTLEIISVTDAEEPPPPPPPPAGETAATLDLRNFLSQGLLAGSMWSVEGYTTWQTERILKNEDRIIPTIHLKSRDWMDKPKSLLSLTEETSIDPDTNLPKPLPVVWKFMLADVAAYKLPLIVRVDNLNSWINEADYDDGTPDVPTVRDSPRKLILGDLGVASFKNQADWLAGTSLWTAEATRWGGHAVSQKLCEILPDPAYVIHLENNEGPRTTPYGGLKKPQADKVWSPLEEIAKTDLRLKEYVEANGTPAFDAVLPVFYSNVVAQYQAYYTALRAQYPTAAWRDFRTSAYKSDGPGLDKPNPAGTSPLGEDDRVDASSSEYYVRALTADLTSLDQQTRLDLKLQRRDYRRARNPRAFTSISVSVLPKTAYQSAKAGIHGIIDPAMFGQWMSWLCWHAHDGGPVQLVWWDNSAVKPTDLFFGDPVFQGELDALGRGDLKGVTCADYPLAMLAAIKRIMEDETLRRHWLDGTNLHFVPPGPVVKSWYVGNQLGSDILIYVWSPVTDPPAVTLTVDYESDGTPETVTVPGVGYWLASPAGVVEVK